MLLMMKIRRRQQDGVHISGHYSLEYRYVRCSMQSDKKFCGFGAKMSRFNQLLNSKYFLLVFINTLEQQLKEFSLHDRCLFSIHFSPVKCLQLVGLNSGAVLRGARGGRPPPNEKCGPPVAPQFWPSLLAFHLNRPVISLIQLQNTVISLIQLHIVAPGPPSWNCAPIGPPSG